MEYSIWLDTINVCVCVRARARVCFVSMGDRLFVKKSEVLRNPVCARHHQQPGWGCESWAQTDRFNHDGFH